MFSFEHPEKSTTINEIARDTYLKQVLLIHVVEQCNFILDFSNQSLFPFEVREIWIPVYSVLEPSQTLGF